MKTKIILIITSIILFATSLVVIPQVFAQGAGGQGSGGGNTGTTGGGTSCNAMTDGGKDMPKTDTYMFDLVYRPKNSSDFDHIACVVIGPHANDSNLRYDTSIHKNCKKITTLGSGNNGSTLANVAGYIAKHDGVGGLNAEINKNSKTYAPSYMETFGVMKDGQLLSQYSDIMSKESTEAGGSYGYRVLIQQFVYIGCSSDWRKYLLLRKEAFKSNVGNNNVASVLGGSVQTDLWTDFKDIGITKGKSPANSTEANYKDKNHGSGYNIIWFDIEDVRASYDYSMDAACENCDSKNDNGSYFVQDTTDWNAILATKNSNNSNTKAKRYFPKKIGNCTVYCREEYRVTFPNENDKITTEAGRFFTINKLGTAMYANGIPNYKQIKVEKVRECRAQDGNQKACLTSFANTAKARTGNSAGSTGTIKLKYKENYKDSKYNTTITLEENKDRTLTKEEFVNSTVGNSTTMLKSTVTKYYELPYDTYRWVNIRDGVSSLKKPSTNVINHFLDLETSNLPISNGNYATKENKGVAGTVTFDYHLPTSIEDPYTLIEKAFNSKNDYFLDPTSKPSDNLYKKAQDNKLTGDEQTQIKQSACAKLYGYGTSKFNKCVSERTTNKAGKCYSQIATDNKYVCNVGVCPEGERLCDDNTCSTDGTCPSNPKCQIVNGTYYGKNGTPVSEAEYAKDCPACKIENGKYYGQDGKEVTKEEYLVECPNYCKIVGGKYYGKKGQIVTKAQYEAECPDSFCTLCNGGKCCPDLDMVCPDEMGECPGKGNTIIYRTIDLTNPFPGQTNYQRQTGANWCSYNSKTGKINCKNTNNVATTHIQNNRKNKDESVYKLTPLYEVELNATNMKAIRKYNREGDHKYDDFTLTCEKGTCKSTFLRDNKYGLNLTGVCNTANYDDLRTCAERGR